MDQSDDEANQDLSEDVNSQELDWMLELHSNFPSAQIEVVSEPAKAPATNEKSEDLPTNEGLNIFQDDDTFTNTFLKKLQSARLQLKVMKLYQWET